jgi:hypothetical protein
MPPPTGANPQTGPVLPSCPSFFLKKDTFVYDNYTGSFIVKLWKYIYVCTYVLYLEFIYPLHYSPFYLSPLLMVPQQFWMFHIHTCVEIHQPYTSHLLSSFTLPLSPMCDLFYILVLH